MRSWMRWSSSSPGLPRRLEPRIGSSRPCCSLTSRVQPNGPRRSETPAGKTSSPRTPARAPSRRSVRRANRQEHRRRAARRRRPRTWRRRRDDTRTRHDRARPQREGRTTHRRDRRQRRRCERRPSYRSRSRIESAAEPGTVLVSSTVVDLVVGSSHDFTAGRRTFAGIAHEWDVFIATR